MEIQELEVQLKTIRGEILAAVGKDADKLEKLEKAHRQVQLQLDAVDLRVQGAHGFGGEADLETKGLGQLFVESEAFKAAQAGRFGGKQPFSATLDYRISRKSVITTTSGITQGTTGVTMPQRLPGISGIARQALRIRDLMNVQTMTTGNAYDFVQQLSRSNNASPQVETSPKAESTFTWNTISDTVKTIANYVNVSRQALDDVLWLQNMLNSELTYGLMLKEETEILSGDGLGQHYNGLIKQATAYAGTYFKAGDTQLDTLNHAKLQCRLAGLATFAPDGIVLNPVDLAKIELIKTEEGAANKGRYVVGDPSGAMLVRTIWDLPVVESDSITAGYFLVGAFGTAAEVIERQGTMVELSYENGTNFVNNVVTILAELRGGLAVRRPGAFIYGAF